MKNKQRNSFSQDQRLLLEALIEDMIDDAIRFIVPDADEMYDLEREIVILEKSSLPHLPKSSTKEETLATVVVRVFRKDGNEEVLFLNIQA